VLRSGLVAVNIMIHFGFDGWFINIEHKMESDEQAKDLVEFVAALREAMHAAKPGSLCIW